MKRFVTITAIVVAAAMAVPAATATWYGVASQEPDNSYDATGGYMWTDGPGDASNQVYFNVVSVFSTDGGTGSPNSASVGSNVEAFPTETFIGFLGVWRDCNHDGYIGLGDAALREYREDVSNAAGWHVDRDLCPVTTEAKVNKGAIFNGNGWVTELMPIGLGHDTITGAPTPVGTDMRMLYDPTAKIWGDHLFPGQVIATGAGTVCSQASYAPGKGQASHTGGLIDHLDCLNVGPKPDYDRVVAADSTGTVASLGLDPTQFYDGGPADVSTFGSPGAESTYTDVVDCGTVNTAPSLNPGGSIAGTVNYTVSNAKVGTQGGSCDPSDGRTDFYKQVEAPDAGGTNANGRTVSDMPFIYRPFNTRTGTTGSACGTGATGATCGMPADAGVPQYYDVQRAGCACWDAQRAFVPSGANQGGLGVDVTKANVVDPDMFPADYWTFYAQTGYTGTFPHAGGSGTYGSDWCGNSIGTNLPPANGWNCDPSKWNLASDGVTPADHKGYGVGQVGDAYQLRDVDCFDDTLVGANAVEPVTGTSLNPLGQPIGAHSVPLLTQTAHACA